MVLIRHKNISVYYFCVFLITFAIGIFFSIVLTAIESKILAFIINGLQIFVSTFLGIGYFRITLKIYDNSPDIGLSDLFSSNINETLKVMFLSFLIALLVGVSAIIAVTLWIIATSIFLPLGIIVLPIAIIIPIAISLMLFFAYDYCIDKDGEIIESIQKSIEITKGKKGEMFLLLIVSAVITILGIITILGWLFTIPMVALMNVYAYRKFLST